MKDTLSKNRVAALLGDSDYKGINQWFQRIFESRCDYVIFPARSYLFALVMERAAGKKLEENSSATFLTDGSAFLFCEELAETYKQKGYFPSILLCDVILVHGRNLNHFLEGMEERLCNLLSDYDKYNIMNAFAESVYINVYAKREPCMILSRYELNIRDMIKIDNTYIHELSNKISALILSSGMPNTCCLYSEHLTEFCEVGFNEIY